MNGLPIPLHTSLSADDCLELDTKRQKTCLPECFIVLVKQGATTSAVGIVNALEVCEYYDSKATTSQYLNHVALGQPIDKRKYCVWKLGEVILFRDGPVPGFWLGLCTFYFFYTQK
jgi:hypothetical protein